jgi:hypothetical protein
VTDVERGGLFDPDVIRRFDSAARVVNVGESENLTIEMKVTAAPVR